MWSIVQLPLLSQLKENLNNGGFLNQAALNIFPLAEYKMTEFESVWLDEGTLHFEYRCVCRSSPVGQAGKPVL